MIDVDSNVVDLERLLGRMAENAGDLSEAWPEIGRWWQARQRTIFTTANRGAWPMRDPDTKKIGRGLLIRTGTLMRAASSPKPLYSSATSARFGMKPGGRAYYGLFHQLGSGVPIREVVPPVIASEGDEVAEIIGKHILRNG